MNGWKFYYPENGGTAADAEEPTLAFYCAEDVAQFACERDFYEHDGWERPDGQIFEIIVIGVGGMEIPFTAHHEPTVSHQVSEKKPTIAE